MSSAPSSEQLRAIIRTQTAIAASDLDPQAIMQLIAAHLFHANLYEAESRDGRRASYGIAASTNRDSDTLFAAADRVLLAAKDRLYDRREG